MGRLVGRDELRRSAHAMHQALLGVLSRMAGGDEAYALAQWMASYLVANPCGIYRCDALEEALLPKAVNTLDELRSAVVARDGVLHLLSEPYRHGGHTRVVRHLIAHARGLHEVLLTREVPSADAHQWLGVEPSRVRILSGLVGRRAQALALAIEIAAYHEVILYLHPDDVVGGVAVRLARKLNPGIRVGFFNHADHAFSVGVGSADCVFEISTYGWQLRKARGIEDRASFVGIPIAVSNPPAAVKSNCAGSRSILLAGTAYKFKPVGDRALLEALDRLLATNHDLSVDLVGPSGDEPWWEGLLVQHGDRMRFHGLLHHERYRALLDAAALYIDSYPKTGGTAFPEALLSGARVIGLYGGTWGFSLADALRVRDVAEFITRCQAILCDAPSVVNQMEDVRQHCETFHAPTAVWLRISEGLRGNVFHALPKSLFEMPMPPILAEDEWLGAGRLQMSLPDRNSPYAKVVHRALWRACAVVFGRLHPGTLRWAATWLARYAARSVRS